MILACRASFFLVGLVLVISTLSLQGCSVLSRQGGFFVSLNEPVLQYSGRGAGASFALMGSMGASGIAIGSAIDSGIAKDIRSTLLDQGYDFNNELCGKLYDSELALSCIGEDERTSTRKIIIDDYKLTGDATITLTLSGKYFLHDQVFDFEVVDSKEIGSVVDDPFPIYILIDLIDQVQLQLISSLIDFY